MATNEPSGAFVDKFFGNTANQFWGLQLLGWAGWVSLFFIRDVYWGQPFERVSLLVVDAAAGFLLTTSLRYFYHLIWEKPIYVRIIGILAGSYLVAAIWQPVKNGAQFVYYDDFRAVEEYGMVAYFNGLFGYSYFLILLYIFKKELAL